MFRAWNHALLVRASVRGVNVWSVEPCIIGACERAWQVNGSQNSVERAMRVNGRVICKK